MEKVKDLTRLDADSINVLKNALNGMSEAQIAAALSTTAFNKEQVITILNHTALDDAQKQAILSTLGFATTTTAATGATATFSTVLQGLKGVMVAHPLLALVTAISAVITVVSIATSAIRKHKQAVAEARQATEEAGNTYKENAASVEEYKRRIAELRAELDAGNLSEQETYEKRRQLLGIQAEIVDELGNEAKAFDILNDSIGDINKSFDNFTASEAASLLAENTKVYAEATKEMEKARDFGTGIDNTIFSNYRAGIEESDRAFKRVQDIFKDVFGDKVSFKPGSDGRIYYELDVDARTAVEGLKKVNEELYNLDTELSHDGLNLNEVLGLNAYDQTWQNSLTEAKKEAQEVVDTFANIYDTAVQARIQASFGKDLDYTKFSDQIKEFKDAYENALVEGNDQAAKEAYENMQTLVPELEKIDDTGIKNYYMDVVDAFNDANEDSYLEIKLKAKLADDNDSVSKMIKDAVKVFEDKNGRIDVFKVGNIGIDYENNIENDIALSEQEQAYGKLKAAAEDYGMEVSDMIKLMGKLGYVTLSGAEGMNALADTYTQLNNKVTAVSSAMETVDKAVKEQTESGAVSAETYQELIGLGKEYADCLEWNGQATVVNQQKINDLNKSLNESTKAELELAKATEQQRWAENAAEILNLQSSYESLDDEKKQHLQSLMEENRQLASNIQQYQVLISQLNYATSGYKAWLDAQSQTDSGKIFDDAASAFKALQEGFKTYKTDTAAYQGALDFLVPDNIKEQGIEAAKAYSSAFLDPLFKEVSDGETGFGRFSEFLDRSVQAGLAAWKEDGSWEINPDINLDDFIERLNITKDLALAIFGELDEYEGWDFDFLNEDTTAALQSVQALIEAKQELNNIKLSGGEQSSEYTDALNQVKELEQNIRELPAKTLAEIGIEIDTETQNILKDGVEIDATTKITVEKDDVQKMIEEYRTAFQALQENPGDLAATQKVQELRDALLSLEDVTKAQYNIDTTLLDSGIASITETLQDYRAAVENLNSMDASVNPEGYADAQKEVDRLKSAIESVPDLEIKTNINLETLDQDILDENFQLQIKEVPISADISPLLSDIESAEQKIQNLQSTSINVDADTTAANNKIDAVQQKVQGLNGTTVTVDADTAQGEQNVNKLYTAIQKIQSKTVKIGVRVTGQNALTSLKSTLDSIKSKTVNITTVNRNISQSSGSAKSFRAAAGGTPGAERTEKVLGGEVGREIVVDPKSGTWKTIGDNGAEFFTLRKGEIVFNAEQTKELLSQGRISGRGRAFLNGNAMVSGGGPVILGNTNSSAGASSSSSKFSSAKSSTASTAKQIEAAADATKSLEESLDETLKKMKETMDDIIGNFEHSIFLMEHKNANPAEIVKVYQQMQNAVHKQAEEYRKLGLDDNSEYIQEMQKQWWEYRDSIRDVISSAYEDSVKGHENAITLTENWLDNAIADNDRALITQYTSDIVARYKAMQKEIHKQAEYYRSIGYSDTSDEISELSDKWWEYYEKIKTVSAEAWQRVVDNAHEALDQINNLYDTLRKAAEEFGESGFITVSTFQEIARLGVENLKYLQDENGLLVINEESIQKVIAARTQQMAIETALNYVQQIRQALNENDVTALMNLTAATNEASASTWGLVYAQLKMLGLNSEQYNNALNQINALRSLADIAVTSIGKVDSETNKIMETQADALDDLLKYVEEMIKQEIKDQVELLENQITSYKEIVDLQKKSLELEREKDKYTETIAEKQEKIADLRKRIHALDLDDSREAAAEKAKLQKELAEKVNDLADYQADHAYDSAKDMLDDMADKYQEEKEKEIDVLENSISSEEKLYRLATKRIEDQWETLYSALLEWNTEYGSVVNSEITEAWDAASQAVQEYGSYLNAVSEIQKRISHETGTGSSKDSEYNTTIGKMDEYDTSGDAYIAEANDIVERMKRNSAQWFEGDKETLHKKNQDLANQFSKLMNTQVTYKNGAWYLDNNRKLYDEFPIYHSGGVAGNHPTAKQKEVFAKLEQGEAVLTERQQQSLYHILDAQETMYAKFGSLFKTFSNNNYIAAKYNEQMSQEARKLQNEITDNHSITISPTIQIQMNDSMHNESAARKIGKTLGESIVTTISDAFAKKGKVPSGRLLKP